MKVKERSCLYAYHHMYEYDCPSCSTNDVKTTSKPQRARAATRKLVSSIKLMATALKDLVLLAVTK